MEIALIIVALVLLVVVILLRPRRVETPAQELRIRLDSLASAASIRDIPAKGARNQLSLPWQLCIMSYGHNHGGLWP